MVTKWFWVCGFLWVVALGGNGGFGFQGLHGYFLRVAIMIRGEEWEKSEKNNKKNI